MRRRDFVKAMTASAAGFVDGENIAIEYRWGKTSDAQEFPAAFCDND